MAVPFLLRLKFQTVSNAHRDVSLKAARLSPWAGHKADGATWFDGGAW